MRETAKAIQEFVSFFKVYWYFSFIYIWWIATTILYFREKKPWKQEEPPFNWIAYIVVVGALFGLFYGNTVVFKAFFEGMGRILVVLGLFVVEVFSKVPDIVLWVAEIMAPKPGQPVLVQIVLHDFRPLSFYLN